MTIQVIPKLIPCMKTAKPIKIFGSMSIPSALEIMGRKQAKAEEIQEVRNHCDDNCEACVMTCACLESTNNERYETLEE